MEEVERLMGENGRQFELGEAVRIFFFGIMKLVPE